MPQSTYSPGRHELEPELICQVILEPRYKEAEVAQYYVTGPLITEGPYTSKNNGCHLNICQHPVEENISFVHLDTAKVFVIL